MDRRTLIACGTLAVVGTASQAHAGSSSGTTTTETTYSLSGIGLPVISDGRLRNYVFLNLSLYLGRGKVPEQIRAKEAYLRDALVKAAHRTPFTLPNDWTRLDERAISNTIMSAANTTLGRGTITRVQVVSQNPRRRTGMPSGR